MNIIAITQARLGSSRLPGKILLEVNKMPLLQIHLQRVRRSKHITGLVVATTFEEGVDKVLLLARQEGADVFQGSTEDVLDRFYQAARPFAPQYVVRLTSDCPLIDPVLIDKVISYTIENQLDYCSNTLEEKYPDGQDVEVFTFTALEKAWQEATVNSDREHVTPYIRKNSTFNNGNLFKSANFNDGADYSNIRMTVDQQEDVELVEALVNTLGIHASMEEYVATIQNDSCLLEKNKHIIRNEGYLKSMRNDH